MDLPAGLVFGQGFSEEEIREMGLTAMGGLTVVEGGETSGGGPAAAARGEGEPPAGESSAASQVDEVPPLPVPKVQQPTKPLSWADKLRQQQQSQMVAAKPPAPAAAPANHPTPPAKELAAPEGGLACTAPRPIAHNGGSSLETGSNGNEQTEAPSGMGKESDSVEEVNDEAGSVACEVRTTEGSQPWATTTQAEAVPGSARGEGGELSALQWLLSAEASTALSGDLFMEPRGLVNNGSTCFMNATLQALVATPHFVFFLDTLAKAVPTLVAQETPTLFALAAFAKEMGTSLPSGQPRARGHHPTAGGVPFNPTCMDPVIATFCPTLSGQLGVSGRRTGEPDQHDAQEFLTYILDNAHQELQALRKIHAADMIGSSPGVSHEDEGWEQVGRANKSAVTRGQENAQGGTTFISAVFGGALRSEVRAPGMRPSATKQHFSVLPLDIYPPCIDSVDAALALLTSPETISGYRAEGSQQPTDATKRVQLLQLPQILVLHLMRFTYGASGTGKLHKDISYGTVLQLRQSMLADGCPSSRGRATYDLLAVVQHHGRSPAGGHYTADVRAGGSVGQSWLHVNDSSVRAVSEAEVLHGQAYLLFYCRRR